MNQIMKKIQEKIIIQKPSEFTVYNILHHKSKDGNLFLVLAPISSAVSYLKITWKWVKVFYS